VSEEHDEPRPDLEQALRDLRSPDAWVRFTAAMALGEPETCFGRQGSERLVRQLLPLLEDEDSYVRHHAAESLGKLGYAEALPALRSTLETERKEAPPGAAPIRDAGVACPRAIEVPCVPMTGA
jgi:HEAT repeat protein